MDSNGEKGTYDLSLLWPPEQQKRSVWDLSDEVIRDLSMETLVSHMCSFDYHLDPIRSVLYQPCQDPAVVEYRQAILNELLVQPSIDNAFNAVIAPLDELDQLSTSVFSDETSLHSVIQRIGELELLIDITNLFYDLFNSITGDIKSAGLHMLQDYIQEITSREDFRQLEKALPDIITELRACKSITIGINLDAHLHPEEALLLSVNGEKFIEGSLLDHLFGNSSSIDKGIAPLHSPPLISKGSKMITGGLPLSGPPTRAKPMMVPLFRDLAKVLEKTTKPIAHELSRYINLNSRDYRQLRPDIIFYVYAVKFIRKIQATGLPLCVPEIIDKEDRVCEIDDNYNLQLALHILRQKPDKMPVDLVVTNNVHLGPQGRIVILTGPNQGGKTTYMQAIGQAQLLAQAGLLIPGQHARISLVDGIYTHYPMEERLELGTGRFGDEARRIRAIFEKITRNSLVLLNESLSTTNPGESLYIAQDIVRGFRKIGLRAIYTTHLHELAASINDINEHTDGDSRIISLVASVEEADKTGDITEDSAPSYRIIESPPLGRSYADRISAKYGISIEQINDLLRERKIIS